MYRGRYILGEHVPLLLLCRDSSQAPSVPDQAPIVRVYSSLALVLSGRMAIVDRYVLDGVFSFKLHLGELFSEGWHRVIYQYKIAGTSYGEEDVFEIVPGGHADGAGISMFHYPSQTNDSVLVQCESGRLVRRRNPRIN